MRASEDKFLEEAVLRERLTQLRDQMARLEAAVEEKDAALVDLRFEVECEREGNERLRRR